MTRSIIMSLLAVVGSISALSEVNEQCIAENNETWSNDNLIGTWYMIYIVTLMGGNLVPSNSCIDRVFTKPTAEAIEQYKAKYNDPTAPFNIDDNPVQVYGSNGLVDGLVMGHNIAKFYVLTPNTTMTLGWDEYTVNAYRMLTPKFIMYTECALRGFTRWLMTTDRHASVEEMEELIKNTPELNALSGRQRFCAT